MKFDALANEYYKPCLMRRIILSSMQKRRKNSLVSCFDLAARQLSRAIHAAKSV